MSYNLTSEEDFTQEKDYGENEQYESKLAGQIYDIDNDKGSPGYKRVGMLIQNVDPQDTMLMSHPRKDFVKLNHAKEVARKRNMDFCHLLKALILCHIRSKKFLRILLSLKERL